MLTIFGRKMEAVFSTRNRNGTCVSVVILVSVKSMDRHVICGVFSLWELLPQERGGTAGPRVRLI